MCGPPRRSEDPLARKKGAKAARAPSKTYLPTHPHDGPLEEGWVVLGRCRIPCSCYQRRRLNMWQHTPFFFQTKSQTLLLLFDERDGKQVRNSYGTSGIPVILP